MIACAVNIPSSREQIIHNHSGILLDGISAENDAAVVIKILSDQKLLKEIGCNAWKKSVRCRWDRQVDRLERVLNKL
jgi:glycosyltransferase involved in cell wall biosynthesis